MKAPPQLRRRMALPPCLRACPRAGVQADAAPLGARTRRRTIAALAWPAAIRLGRPTQRPWLALH